MNNKTTMSNITLNAVPNAIKFAPKTDKWTKLTVENALAFMERTGNISCAVEIPLDKLVLPEIQRKRRDNTIARIKKEFNPLLVEYLVVNYNVAENQWEIIDGQHTAIALKELGRTTAQCKMYINLTLEEKVLIFTSQYKKKTKITGLDEYNVYKVANMDPAKTIAAVSDEFGVTIGGPRGTKRNVTSFRKPVKIVEAYGAEGLRFCYQLIKDTGWQDDAKAYTESVLNIGYYAYPECGNNKEKYDTLISLLSQYKTSTHYINRVRFDYAEVSAKHPEQAMGRAIRDILK